MPAIAVEQALAEESLWTRVAGRRLGKYPRASASVRVWLEQEVSTLDVDDPIYLDA